MMAAMGARPGSQISYEQFRQAHMKQQSTGSVAASASKPPAADPAVERELRVAFEQFDLDRSGFISAGELKGVMQQMGQVGAISCP
jgi:Ca2+-binding EF-hand superfamily protein